MKYKALLNEQIEHYLKLYECFIEQHEQENENLVAKRLEIVQKELEELLIV